MLAVGDAEFQKKALGKMKEVSTDEGRTVLFVSHNMAAIRRLCEKGIYMDRGKIKLNNDIDSVISYLSVKELEQKVSTASIGGIKVKKILFKDGLGREIKTFATHDSISILMQCEADRNIEKASFALGFDNIYENRVTSLWYIYLGQEFDVKVGEFEVVFNIDKIKLLPGEYYITTYIASRGHQIERIDNYTKISISFLKSMD